MKRITLLAALAALISGCSEAPQQAAAPAEPDDQEVAAKTDQSEIAINARRLPCRSRKHAIFR